MLYVTFTYLQKCQNLHRWWYNTHTHATIVWLYEFCPGQPGWAGTEETFTHSHLLWSSIVSYLLHPSNMIHGILPVQYTHLTVFFHNLCPSFLWSTSRPGTLHFILHTFLHPITVLFFQHMPIPYTITACFAVVLRLCHLILVSLSALYSQPVDDTTVQKISL